MVFCTENVKLSGKKEGKKIGKPDSLDFFRSNVLLY